MMSKTVEVALVPVTKEQSEMLQSAAQTLMWLYYLSGRPEHKEQSEVAFYFSNGRYGGREFNYHQLYKVPVDEKDETAVA